MEMSLVHETIDPEKITRVKLSKNPDIFDYCIEFDCEIVYNFIGQDVSNAKVGRLLNHMRNSINSSMERKRADGSITKLQKV